MKVSELVLVVGTLRAEIVALQARIEALESQPTMRVKPQVAPRPVTDDTGRAERAAAISRLAERFPDRRSFTSLEVMDELNAHA